MISLKKSYARQLLQLVLTLSLLRVDPEQYLGWGWESQLALQNGDGWQLELRGAPLTNHSYSNRKALIPLIEDLVRFDHRQHDITASYDVQTYLLNVQNEQMTAMASSSPPSTGTATANVPSTTTTTTGNQSETNATATIVAASLGQQAQNSTRNTTDFTVSLGSDLADLFLNADIFAEQPSVYDQNLADLNDFEGDGQNVVNDPFANFQSLYAGLPLKDEPSEIAGSDRLVNLRIGEGDAQQPQAASTSGGDSGENPFDFSQYYSLLQRPDSPRLNYTKVIEWSEYFKNETNDVFNDIHNVDNQNQNNENQTQATITEATISIKQEPEENKDDVEEHKFDAGEGTSTGSNRRHADSGMKLEPEFEEDSDGHSSHSDGKNSTSGFSSNVELTEEVSAL